ncbi:hypothetical protein HMPREF0551_2039 [Lautropia mirabilis ATCC 51599]|uniref:Uncharacterized protein n=1 Tax=Lautropia mirabilis ATCC 51599 TaxID=887898 RepID=E7RZC5_9BURK|nr:hypothetical protein HMPREF0551_2039 [Lautropia mirabilis ATCC 51599]
MSERASKALRQMEASWSLQQDADSILDGEEEHAWRSRTNGRPVQITP